MAYIDPYPNTFANQYNTMLSLLPSSLLLSLLSRSRGGGESGEAAVQLTAEHNIQRS